MAQSSDGGQLCRELNKLSNSRTHRPRRNMMVENINLSSRELATPMTTVGDQRALPSHSVTYRH